jgi:hypothetical protein
MKTNHDKERNQIKNKLEQAGMNNEKYSIKIGFTYVPTLEGRYS